MSTPSPRVGVTKIIKEPHDQFFWMACYLFPRLLCFDFCYDLNNWAQDQAFRAFFVAICFSTILSKYWGILIKHGRKLHRHLAHDPNIVDH